MIRVLRAGLVAGCLAWPAVAQQTAAPVVPKPAPVQAALPERGTLGWGRLFSNDILGDGHDRWRTGSYTLSLVRGPQWKGTLPGFGQIVEYRLRNEIIASSNLADPDPDDRRYAGVLGFGLFTHFDLAGNEATLGADLVATGPQTGVGRFQAAIHDLIGAPEPGGLDRQIPDGFHPTLMAELARTVRFSQIETVRPFVEARLGDETLLRVGADFIIGGLANGSLLLRDSVTGQRYQAISGTGPFGPSLVLGADIARVARSIYLPSSDAIALSPVRSRLRAGLHWQGQKSEGFYGLSWLSEEFEGQPGGQLLGSITLRLRF